MKIILETNLAGMIQEGNMLNEIRYFFLLCTSFIGKHNTISLLFQITHIGQSTNDMNLFTFSQFIISPFLIMLV